jgi:hypothetical protein
VKLLDGSERPIRDLQIGDRFLTLDPFRNEWIEDELILWIDSQSKESSLSIFPLHSFIRWVL